MSDLFADLSAMLPEWFFQDSLRILAAVLIGGLVGAEREYRDKSAGFRTMIFICVGAALFTIISRHIAGAGNDPGRIAANIVTGVGFLGAGALIRDGGKVSGLTTASTVWLVAALGMGVGAGHYLITCVATAAVLSVLWIFPFFEEFIDRARETRHYHLVCKPSDDHFTKWATVFEDCGLRIVDHKHMKSKEAITCEWEVIGKWSRHDTLVERFLNDPEVMEFSF